MNPVTHDFIDRLESHLGSFEEREFPSASSYTTKLLGSPHYIRTIPMKKTTYCVRAGVEFHSIPHQQINEFDDVSEAISNRNPPAQEQLTVEHYDEPSQNPRLWCHFDYTDPQHTITHEEPELGRPSLERKQRIRDAYKQSKQFIPDTARQSTRAKPERKLADTSLNEVIEPQHTFTDNISKHKDDISRFLDAYITHLQR